MFQWVINIFKSKKQKNIITIDGGTLIEAHKAPEQDPKKIILKESRDRLNQLSIYMNYFNIKQITDIFNQTQLIHDVFSENQNLTFKKLNQYHYYYTDNLIELLDKLKKTVDEKVSILNTQIKSNYNKLTTTNKIITENRKDLENLSNLKLQYTGYMSMQISSIYNCLEEKFNDFRYKKSSEFKFFNYYVDDITFWQMDANKFIELIKYDEKKMHIWDDFIIEKLLIGKLQKNLFLIDFIGCFNIDDKNILELYKISDTNDYFIYNTKTFLFKSIKYTDVLDLCVEDNTKLATIKEEVNNYNEQQIKLESNLKNIKRTCIDTSVKELLNKYLVKIEDLDLLDKLSDINAETKNLETLLKLERLDI